MAAGANDKNLRDSSTKLLVSIRAKYAEMIFSGAKRVELRRRKPKVGPGDHMIVYASLPTAALIGVVLVEDVIEKSPAGLWRSVRSFGGITRREFDEYFWGTSTAFGILISQPVLSAKPMTLRDLRRSIPSFHPPQSYWYLRSDRIRDRPLLNWARRIA